MTSLPVPSLHLITSRRRLATDARTPAAELAALDAQIASAIEAGVDVVQVRERDLEARVLYELVLRTVARAAGSSTRILVNERADVAAAAGAAGVHLPSVGAGAHRMKEIDATWVVGRSLHGEDSAGDGDACDYLMFGTVFISASKAVGHQVAGLDALAAAASRLLRPVIGVGGITPATAGRCLTAGAAGVAAIGAFLPGASPDAPGVRAAVAAFREVFDARDEGTRHSSGPPTHLA